MLVHRPKDMFSNNKKLILENEDIDTYKLSIARNICRKFYSFLIDKLNAAEKRALVLSKYKNQYRNQVVYLGDLCFVGGSKGYLFILPFGLDSKTININIIICKNLPDNSKDMGAYDSDTKIIYIRLLDQDYITINTIRKVKSMRYILIHEAVHLLDDIEKQDPQFFNYNKGYYQSEAEFNAHFNEFLDFINQRILSDIENFKDLSAFCNKEYVEKLLANILYGSGNFITLSNDYEDYDELMSLKDFFRKLSFEDKEKLLQQLVDYYTKTFKDIRRNWRGKTKEEKFNEAIECLYPLFN